MVHVSNDCDVADREALRHVFIRMGMNLEGRAKQQASEGADRLRFTLIFQSNGHQTE